MKLFIYPGILLSLASTICTKPNLLHSFSDINFTDASRDMSNRFYFTGTSKVYRSSIPKHCICHAVLLDTVISDSEVSRWADSICYIFILLIQDYFWKKRLFLKRKKINFQKFTIKLYTFYSMCFLRFCDKCTKYSTHVQIYILKKKKKLLCANLHRNSQIKECNLKFL